MKRMTRAMRGIIFLLVGGIWLVFILFFNPEPEEYILELEETTGVVESFTSYGRYFNISGKLEGSFENINDIKVVLNNASGDLEYDSNYLEGDSYITFKTNEKINEGIILDDIKVGDYYILLKIIYEDESHKYYGLENDTEYEDLDYYTLTKDNKNNYIKIDFTKDVSYFRMNVTEKELPDDIYDIVIDPGHGGIDSGARNGDIHESDLVLDIALDLEKELEKIGYKVKLTRETDIDPGEKTMDPYSAGGRALTANDVRAKYLLSIHLNSDVKPVPIGGVEIYACPNSDLTLAQSFADNIKKYANTTYSVNPRYKISDGVYVRGFLSSEIIEMDKEALEKGYAPYNITNNTPYYYMLRETGGIITGAYVDGRNERYSINPYFNSNYGTESYILELGYIINSSDLSNVQDNSYKYINGIVETLKFNKE